MTSYLTHLDSTISLNTVVGIFFGTSTGSTQEAADLISATFGDDAASEPIDIEEVDSVADEFSKYDALVVGKVRVSIILYVHAGVQYKVSVIWPPHST